MTQIRIALADDHQMFREGIKRLFATTPDISVVADCDTGLALMGALRAGEAEVALVDISMPGPGIQALVQQVQDENLPCALVALTMHLEPSFARGLLDQGLAGYVIKDAAFDEVLDAVRTAAAGGTYLSPKLREREDGAALSARELACLQEAATGAVGKEIARRLGITERTVRFHIANACRKLGVTRRAEAIAVAIKRGLISG